MYTVNLPRDPSTETVDVPLRTMDLIHQIMQDEDVSLEDALWRAISAYVQLSEQRHANPEAELRYVPRRKMR